VKVKKEIEEIGRKCVTVKADLTSMPAIRRAFRIALRQYGRIDLLVNNAGLFIDAAWNSFDEKLWDKTIATNLTAPTFLMQEVAKIMIRNGGGSIINIASVGGLQPWAKHIPYSISKAGLIMSTRCFARALAPSIRVNAIAPGTIIIAGEEHRKLKHIPIDKIPLRRNGTPDDITDLVAFLATRGDYITGQVIAVDGGRTIVPIGE
jgi:NAD(P)-dependent dehydrogenase (short-subunit alcohol dehydrogenase family)